MSQQPRAPEPGAPTRIHADRAARELQIDWSDGHRTVYDFTTLRWLCPCAYCRGEAGLPGWLDAGPTLTEQQTALAELSLVGNYAVAPTWGDGHHTGFYTWDRLRDQCPCPEHAVRRSGGRQGSAGGASAGRPAKG